MTGERRKWFRFQVLAGNDRAVLCAGSQEHLVELKNVSTGGYAAVCEQPLDVAVGDLLPLKTCAGWLEVRVVRLEDHGTAIHLGLERVRELQSGPRRTLLNAVGGRRGLAVLVLAALAGLVLGVWIVRGGGWAAPLGGESAARRAGGAQVEAKTRSAARADRCPPPSARTPSGG